MGNELRGVIDTGAVIGALLIVRSLPRRALDEVLARGRLLESEATVAELDSVLRRPKFERYLRERDRLEFLATLIQESEVVNVTEEIRACRDPEDNKFLSLAISGAASHIISGDRDLLLLHPFRGIPILSPRKFLDLFFLEGPE